MILCFSLLSILVSSSTVPVQNNLLNELITLISVDDFRIRENAAKCITNFINNFNLRGSNAGSESGRGNGDATGNVLVADDTENACYMKQNLVHLFATEKVVDGMSKYLRELFSVKKTGKQRSVHEISSMLAKVFYILTNKLLDFHKKSEHVSRIFCCRVVLWETMKFCRKKREIEPLQKTTNQVFIYIFEKYEFFHSWE